MLDPKDIDFENREVAKATVFTMEVMSKAFASAVREYHSRVTRLESDVAELKQEIAWRIGDGSK
jgi:hypothetical protein